MAGMPQEALAASSGRRRARTTGPANAKLYFPSTASA